MEKGKIEFDDPNFCPAKPGDFIHIGGKKSFESPEQMGRRLAKEALAKPPTEDSKDATISLLRSQLEVAVKGLEQNEGDFHLFGCPDNQCHYADPPNQVGTNGGCSCHNKSGFREAVRRIRIRNRESLAQIDKLGRKGK